MAYFYKNLIVEVIIAAILILAFGGGILFFRARISDLAEQTLKTRQVLAERSSSLQLYSSLRTQYDSKGKKYLNVLQNIVPTRDQLIDLRQEFQSLAARENLDFGFTFFPGDETTAASGELGAIKFNLNLKGGLDELLNFIHSLEKFRYLITLESFTMNRQGSSIQMAIKGQVYFRQ